MGRRSPDNSWESSGQRRARGVAGERSYPPTYTDESAFAEDPYTDDVSDPNDSVVIPAITLPTMRVPRQSTARPLSPGQRLALPDDFDLDEYEQPTKVDARA